MQSDVAWIKNLARSRFQNGRWVTADEPLAGEGPFGALIEAIADAVDTYNHHSGDPIRTLVATGNTATLLTLLHGGAQLKFARNGAFLDVTLLKTKNFQTNEQPLARLSPNIDVFGHATWKRGATEWSTEQVIKTALVQLLESSHTV